MNIEEQVKKLIEKEVEKLGVRIDSIKLEKEDNEEVEVNVELNSESIKRGGRKLKRELKYYYVENKLFII